MHMYIQRLFSVGGRIWENRMLLPRSTWLSHIREENTVKGKRGGQVSPKRRSTTRPKVSRFLGWNRFKQKRKKYEDSSVLLPWIGGIAQARLWTSSSKHMCTCAYTPRETKKRDWDRDRKREPSKKRWLDLLSREVESTYFSWYLRK